MWEIIGIIILVEILLNFTRPNAVDCLLKNPLLLIILAIHHVTNAFLLYGWLFNDKILLSIHIFFCVSIMAYWKFNKGFCHATLYVNEKCNWDKTDLLRDVLYYSGLKQSKLWKKELHYVIITLLCSISIYKLVKNNRLTTT